MCGCHLYGGGGGIRFYLFSMHVRQLQPDGLILQIIVKARSKFMSNLTTQKPHKLLKRTSAFSSK